MRPADRKPVLDPEIVELLATHAPPISPSKEASDRIRSQLYQRLHQPGSDYFVVHSHHGAWVTLLEGVEIKLLREDADTRSFLIRMAPGARIPPHEHPLDEESLVLEGEVTVDGVLCKAGDYHFAPPGGKHDWITSTTGCLFFVRGASRSRAER